MNKMLFYVSSTFGDLRPFREAAFEVVYRAGGDVLRMESLPASLESPLELTRRFIAEADVFILIVGHRYGALIENDGKSFLELEYETAVTLGKPVLAFIVSQDAPWSPADIDSGESGWKLQRFKDRLLSAHVVAHFSSVDDLKVRLFQALLGFLVPDPTSEGNSSSPEPPEVSSELTLSQLYSFLSSQIMALQTEIRQMHRMLEVNGVGTNRQIHPTSAAPFLGAPAVEVIPNRVFVAMPYSQPWSTTVADIISRVCGEVGMSYEIAKNMDGRFIPHDIYKGITRANIIIADLTGENANVAYELGLADSINKEVILISQTKQVPFDFSAQRLIIYDDSLSGAMNLQEELVARLEMVRASQQTIDQAEQSHSPDT